MKLTSNLLKRIVQEEVTKAKRVKEAFGKMKDADSEPADEVEADELGTDKTLEKKIDYAKALKVEAKRLARRLARVNETRRRIARSIIKDV